MTEYRFHNTAWNAGLAIVKNTALAVIKGAFGLLSGSLALTADAVHTATHVAGSYPDWAARGQGKRSPEEDRFSKPGSAGKLSAVLMAAIMILLGFEIGRQAWLAFFSSPSKTPHPLAFVVILLSVAYQEGLFQYKYRQGRKMGSQGLMADAWQHRTGLYASIIALIGTGGALAGRALEHPQLYKLDAAAAMIIAVMILRASVSAIAEVLHVTTEKTLHEADAAELLEAVQRIRGVITVDELHAKEHGHYVLVDLTISVNPRITVQEGHEIAKLVKQHLMKRFSHISNVFIHVNPYDAGYPYKLNTDQDHDDVPTLLH